MLVELVLADLRSNGWLKARAAFTKFPRVVVGGGGGADQLPERKTKGGKRERIAEGARRRHTEKEAVE